jgi:hypothetical protein
VETRYSQRLTPAHRGRRPAPPGIRGHGQSRMSLGGSEPTAGDAPQEVPVIPQESDCREGQCSGLDLRLPRTNCETSSASRVVGRLAGAASAPRPRVRAAQAADPAGRTARGDRAASPPLTPRGARGHGWCAGGRWAAPSRCATRCPIHLGKEVSSCAARSPLSSW